MISGIDGLQDTLKEMSEGKISHKVFQNASAQAKAAVEVLQQIKDGQTPKDEAIVPFEPITKENLSKYMQ